MSGRTLRSLGLGLVTTVGAGLLTLTAMMDSGVAYGEVSPDPADPTIGLVMGGTGNPLPGIDFPGYVETADTLYIHPNFPDTTYPPAYANGLFTPEQLYPLTGVHTLPLDYPIATTGPLAGFPAVSTSVGQGMLILENAIQSNTAAEDASTVFGWSQSALISSLVMQQLDPNSTPMPNDGLQFVLIGDPVAPNGGLLTRFDGATLIDGQTIQAQANIASLGLSLSSPATPADSFPTDIYTLEYDGYADFPKYPIDFLADLNAFLGIDEIHGLYLTPDVVSPAVLANAKLLEGSAAAPFDTPDSLTNYYMIPLSDLPYPHDYLPLLQPLVGIPVVGKPLADLLQPDLAVLVNLGYGSTTQGWSPGPADVPTPFGLWPTNITPTELFTGLEQGAVNGWDAFLGDLQNLSLASPVPAVSSAVATAPAALPSLTDIVNAFSSAASSLYSVLLPTADFVNALVTTMPAYDVSLFTGALSSGDLLDAFGLPIAADTEFLTLAAGFEFQVLDEGITAAINAISALIP